MPSISLHLQISKMIISVYFLLRPHVYRPYHYEQSPHIKERNLDDLFFGTRLTHLFRVI